MSIENKVECFDYLVYSLIKKCFNTNTSSDTSAIRKSCEYSSLGKLKLMKLLFFITAMNINDWYLLDKVFCKFYAMPYGPVESDIYNNLGSMKHFEFMENRLRVKDDVRSFSYDINIQIKDIIDESIDKLKSINPNIFTMGAFELVELSHKADSWRIIFNEAQVLGRLSLKMPCEVIKLSKVYLK